MSVKTRGDHNEIGFETARDLIQCSVEYPTLIVGMANQYWVRETSIPAAQRASLMAWSRLFALPLLIAENK